MPARVVGWITRDQVDWDAVYAEQLPRVYNFFRYRCANPADAEDLTSVTFEKAWRGRDRFRRDKGSFSTWLFTIARNAAIDHYRARTLSVPLDEAATVAAAGTPEADTLLRSRTVRGADHPDTLACAWNVALDAGDATAQEQALAALTKAYGDGHPVLADAQAGQRLETDIDPPPL